MIKSGAEEKMAADKFERIFLELRPKFETIACSYVRRMDVAQDIVHDSFLLVWERRATLTDTNIEAYIYCVVRSKCLHYIRDSRTGSRIRENIHRSTLRVMDYYTRSMESCDPGRLFESEVARIVKQELSDVPELSRNVFLAHKVDRMTYKDISNAYSIPVKRVAREIQRVLSVLRRSLRDYLPVLAVLITVMF